MAQSARAHPGTRDLGPVDCAALIARTLALSEDTWWEDAERQIDSRNVHAQTQSILLIFCKGWPDPRIAYRTGWAHLGRVAVPVMQAIVAQHYPTGGKVLRSMVARLPPGARIHRHRDVDPSFAVSHRIHVPLQTNDDVSFIVGSERVLTRTARAFELDNLQAHEVINAGVTHRIHFIFDYLPPFGSH